MAQQLPPPNIKTPFKDAVLWDAGKGNKKGVETTKPQGKGSSERG